MIKDVAKIIEENFDCPDIESKKILKRMAKRVARIKLQDDTLGYALWAKYSRAEYKKVSSRCAKPKAAHLAGIA